MLSNSENITVLDAIQHLTQLRTELLLFTEAEKTRVPFPPLPSDQYQVTNVTSLNQAEKAVRFAALLWLMDIAARVSVLADDLMEEVSQLPGIALEQESMRILSERGQELAESLEQSFLQHMDVAQHALRQLHGTMSQPQVHQMDNALSIIRQFFHQYLESPEDTIHEMLGAPGGAITVRPALN